MVGEYLEVFDVLLCVVVLIYEIDYIFLWIVVNYNFVMVYYVMGNFDDCIVLEKIIVSVLFGDMEVSCLGWIGYLLVFCCIFYGNSLVELGWFVEVK